MKIFIYAVSDDLQDIATELEEAISAWVSTHSAHCELISIHTEDCRWQRVGMHLQVKKAAQLKDHLNNLHSLARTHKCDFVIGILPEDETDEGEEVCFFGYNEGRPDMFEVGCYLGLN